ncbi:T9SS type A sorting domain-containing protein [Flavobacterium sp. CYK-4]|uniref:T9SS type A sorting domain-containing protein n=1 Tax=Flavobacterium lotistagni TaxID=2709660 RepID=UPI00140B8779|nr:T9SS type A sorting domain-containing protein [Flavobacterium lotistagni]NHM07912.1 T9SS type A sorting domain-containing protein [Flavobacterium lotistagni]
MKQLYFSLMLFSTATFYGQIVNIPDTNFKNYLLTALLLDTDNNMVGDSTIDTNNNGEIEQNEALLINELYVNGLNISSLVGVEYFTNLIRLRFNDNQVATVDLHALNQLQHIQCNNNLLTEISLCGTPATSLWAEGNPNLTYISIKNNTISTYYASRSSSENTPPALPSFMFPSSLQTLCYDAGELDSVSFVPPTVNLITDCETVCSVLAVENPELNSVITLAPNPAVSFIEIDSTSNTSSVLVYNALGQLVQKHVPATATTSIKMDVSGLEKGTYLVEINSKLGKTTRRLIKS